MNFKRSEALFEAAKQRMPGGVSSPVRAFRAVGGTPLYIERAEGPYIYDADGNKYIDYVGSWGPMILGHAPKEVVAAVKVQAERGTSYGAPTGLETRLAELISEAVPGVERVRFVNSGTEATMSALRVARAYAGREKILKFIGCYHGHADGLLVSAGSGVATLGLPDSPGVTKGAAADTLTAPFNDLDAVREIYQANPGQIAAIILEPVAGNMGLVQPAPGFLKGLREIADAEGSVLIFDEVMTGFRVAHGGATARFGVQPDMVTLGKVIGGGLPVGAYGGRSEIMSKVAPAGKVYQAGTLSGNPLAMAAGIAQLEALKAPGLYEALEEKTGRLAEGLKSAAEKAGLAVTSGALGSMFGMFFNPDPVSNFEEAARSDTERFAAWFWAMIRRGVYLAPSQFEAGFVSTVHDDAIIDQTLAVADEAMQEITGS